MRKENYLTNDYSKGEAYSDCELENIIDYLSRLYHVKEDPAVINLKVAIRYKKYDKDANKFTYVKELYKLGDLLNKNKCKAILERIGKYDIAISLNQFKNNSKNAGMKDLISVNAIGISIDYGKTKFANDGIENVLEYLKENVFGDIEEIREFNQNKLPWPNVIQVWSNKLTFVFYIERCRIPINNVKNNRNIKCFLQSIKNKMENLLIQHGFEIYNKSQFNDFVYLPYSIRTKYMFLQEVVEIFDIYHQYIHEDIYIFQTIANIFSAKEDMERMRGRLLTNKENVRRKGTPKMHNIRDYNKKRLEDIEKMFMIGKLGLDNGVISYIRIAYMYAVHLKLLNVKYTSILNRVVRLFDRNGVRIAVRDVNDWIYQVKESSPTFCADYMAEYFGLTQEICKEYGLTSFVLTKGSKRYGRKEYNKYYYDTYVKTSHKEVRHLEANDKREIKKLYKDNYKVRDIAEKYGVSLTNIYFVLKDEIRDKKEDEEQMLENIIHMLDSGMNVTIKEIARALNLNYESLRKRIYRYRNKKKAS